MDSWRSASPTLIWLCSLRLPLSRAAADLAWRRLAILGFMVGLRLCGGSPERMRRKEYPERRNRGATGTLASEATNAEASATALACFKGDQETPSPTLGRRGACEETETATRPLLRSGALRGFVSRGSRRALG